MQKTICLVACALGFGASGLAASRPVDVEAHVRSRMALEDLLWRRRLWPAENEGVRPPMGAAERLRIRERALDDLRKAQALGHYFGRGLTRTEVQAELRRMIAGSKDRALLADMLAVLDHDAERAALVIALPAIADRLVRSRYAFDARLHGPLGEQARHAREAAGEPEAMRQMGGRYREETLRRSSSALTSRPSELDPHEWDLELERLAGLFPQSPDAGSAPGLPPAGVVSAVQEDERRYYVVCVLALGKDQARVASVEWPKVPFDTWWLEASRAVPARLPDFEGGFQLPALELTACTDDTWLPTHLGTPSARNRHTAVWTGTEMIVWGGYRYGFARSGGRYNPSTDTWVPTSDSGAPSARFLHTAVWTGTVMIVWGGGTTSTPTDTGGRYDPVSDSWLPTALFLVPEARLSHTAVWTGTEMIVWGGQRLGPTTRFDTGGRYDPVGDSWVATNTTGAPSPRSSHGAVWAGIAGCMVVWGGTDGTSLATGGRYYPATNTWLPTNPSGAPGASYQHATAWSGSLMLVWGGSTSPGGRYDPVADSWAAITPTDAPPSRQSPSAVWAGVPWNVMIVWGGYAAGWLNSGGRYDPVADSWQPTSSLGAPTGRRYHSAVWTGSRMILWGGTSAADTAGENTGALYYVDNWIGATKRDTPSGASDHSAVWTGVEMIVWGSAGGSAEGSRYTPSTDSWQPTTMAGAPSARAGHTAVWTGSEMVVWGGEDTVGPASTGGRYNPGLDSWQATPTANAPLGRWDHEAVWTGSRMIVWGGATSSGYVSTGGRLDVSGAAWQPTSLVGAPSARSYHGVVWTGSRMIVFGGDQGAAPFDDGGRYDPVADTWLSVAPSGAARSGHAAVWTGSRMIVWGGWDGIGYLNTGMRYDPGSDAWDVTGPTPAPGRALPVGVWTSGSMLVWGGYNGSYLGDGIRYDPVLDYWAPMNGTGAPTPRALHTAVWTGERMIVWGGYDPAMTNTGGLYCACATPVTAGWNDLRATRGATTVDLAWDPGWPGVAGYGIYRDAVPNSPWGAAQHIGGPQQATSFSDTPPGADVIYYLVKAIGSCGDEVP